MALCMMYPRLEYRQFFHFRKQTPQIGHLNKLQKRFSMTAMMLQARALLNRPCLLVFSSVLLLLPSSGNAQVLYGSLTGNVVDASDASIPGAKVEAANASAGIVRQTTTDSRGVYLFS